MKNSDMPAMPCQPLGQDGMPSWEMTYGLTKREMFAMAAMQGLIASGATYVGSTINRNSLAQDAIDMADALLEKLEQAK